MQRVLAVIFLLFVLISGVVVSWVNLNWLPRFIPTGVAVFIGILLVFVALILIYLAVDSLFNSEGVALVGAAGLAFCVFLFGGFAYAIIFSIRYVGWV